jgi:molybdenum cofactor biosynthesis enzyme MoaA
LQELHSKNVINRISITGGEPLLNLSSLDSILESIIDACGKETYHVSINTNGINLNRAYQMRNFDVISDIHVSRHSIFDEENDKIFGIRTPKLSEISSEIKCSDRSVYSLSCNLLKGHVDSVTAIQQYLDAAIQIGIYQVGFVSLMDKTAACKDLFIDYEDISNKLSIRDGFLFDTMAKDGNSCKCENYIYYNDCGQIPVYFRRVLGGEQTCVKAFVYNQDNNLVTNFGKDMVLL